MIVAVAGGGEACVHACVCLVSPAIVFICPWFTLYVVCVFELTIFVNLLFLPSSSFDEDSPV